MIVENGTIRPITQSGEGLVNGNPTPPIEVVGDPIAANIRSNSRSSVGKSNGNTFTLATFEVLIARQELAADCIELSANGVDLGTFPILSIEILEAVDAIKILV